MRKILPSLATVPILVTATILAPLAFAASEDETPEPQPTPVTAADAGNAMPLALYQSLRKKVLTLAEPQTPAMPEQADVSDSESAQAPKPPEVPASEQTLMALREEVRSNEATIIQALANAPQSIQRELSARVLSLATDHKTAVPALSNALEKDKDADVRVAAATALGVLKDAHGVDALIKGLQDSSEDVRSHSAAALGQIRDERAVPGLMNLLRSDPRPLLRLQAALSLGKIKTGVNESELAGLLDGEVDERVKMAIAAAVRAISGTEASAVAEVPDDKDFRKTLTDLSQNMKDVEQKLRDDRHDESVQVDQKNIDDKLNDLIRELENMSKASSNTKQETEREKQKKMRMAMMGQEGSMKNGQRNGRAGEKLGPAEPPGAINASTVVGRKEKWAALPEKERDELLQVFRPEVPLRWRKRLEAYFVSVAAEEAKKKSDGPVVPESGPAENQKPETKN